MDIIEMARELGKAIQEVQKTEKDQEKMNQ